MTAEQWAQIKELLEHCLVLPERERAEFLSSNAFDPAVRAEVESLLAAHGPVSDFLETPVEPGRDLAPALSPGSAVGQNIGRYELVEEIGRGGMGTVYRAVRADHEFEIEVAVKVVSRGLDTDLLLRRFRTERQILAGLDHPYIARLLDGGSTDSGLPYFVMEYVKGVPLVEYCDTNRLGITERLQLFRKVCEAVSYAHQRLVVHRDLKPANILVTADGTPKLLDFGIARLLTNDRANATEVTATLGGMATPAYASPEQIRGKTAGVASDVYSLGVVLYELLTGHRPYRLDNRAPGELAQLICHRPPTKASLVVGYTEAVRSFHGEQTSVDPASVCSARNIQFEALRRKLSGDLDNILAMALEKDPSRRYASVEQFSEDLLRHMRDLPVLARPETLRYRAGKFVARNRAPIAGVAVFALLLCAATAYAWEKAHRLSQRIVEDQRLATTFLVKVHDSIETLPGATPAREAMLKGALDYLGGLARDAGEDSSYHSDLAMAYEKFADLQMGVRSSGLGQANEALKTLLKAQAIRKKLWEDKPDDQRLQMELANNYLLASYIVGRAKSASERVPYDAKALELALRLVETDHRNLGYRALLARAHTNAAYTAMLSNDLGPARDHLEQALALRLEMSAENPRDLRLKRDLAQIQHRLGTSYLQAGDLVRAREQLEDALRTERLLLTQTPENAQFRSDLAGTLHFLAMLCREENKNEAALGFLDEAITIRKAAFERDPRDNRMRTFLAGNYGLRSELLLRAAQPSDAVAEARRAVELQSEVLATDPRSAPARISMAEHLAREADAELALAESSRSPGRWQNALRSYSEACRLFNQLQQEGHLRTPQTIAVAARARKGADRCQRQLLPAKAAAASVSD